MITVKPVAKVHSTRTEITDDHWAAESISIELDPSFPDESLDGIEGFSHLEIIFHFHRADPSRIETGRRHPRNNPDWPEVGVFASRGKNRPNHLGLTIVELVERRGRTLIVEGLDALDGTPVLDIKPVIKGFLPTEDIRQPGWADEIMRQYWSK
jgi:tRNA-Thr(GGU) m(6)t(6)A37 methyltransferase TsaA